MESHWGESAKGISTLLGRLAQGHLAGLCHGEGVLVHQHHHGEQEDEEEVGNASLVNLLSSAHATLASLACSRVLT